MKTRKRNRDLGGPHTVLSFQGPDSHGLPLLREGAKLHESQHPGSDSSLFRPCSASNHRPEAEERGIVSPETERVWGGRLGDPPRWRLAGESNTIFSDCARIKDVTHSFRVTLDFGSFGVAK